MIGNYSIQLPEDVNRKLVEFDYDSKTAVLVSIDAVLSGMIAISDTTKKDP